MPTSDYVTDVSSVGAILRSRTRDTNGNEIGTFTEQTRPTGDQVLSLMREAATFLSSAVGSDLPAQFIPVAQALVAYRTAAMIELSYYPEQVALGRSPYTQFVAMYDGALSDLRVAVEAAGGDVPGDPTSPGTGTPTPEAPSWAFPPATGSLDAVLGLPVGTYAVPWSGGLYQ